MICTSCHGSITDRAMKAGDKLYHENHFLCSVCSTSLTSVPVYTKHEQLYCEADYMAKFVPVCARCDQYITQVHYTQLECDADMPHNQYCRSV